MFTDGRDELLERTLDSAALNLVGPITEMVVFDDTGDLAHADRLRASLDAHGAGWRVIQHPEGRRGFGGAIRAAWAWLRRHSEARFVFHLEDDFTFERAVDLDRMVGVLESRPELVQLALRRQAWNEAERAAGGVIELRPEAYLERETPLYGKWLEHREFFTTNPSLYRLELVRARAWPAGPHSEGLFSLELFTDPDLRCGYWGARTQPPWVHHIGAGRAGEGY